jgi:hypothetical protein
MVYTLTLDSTSWLATLTGDTTLTMYTNGNLEEICYTALAVGDDACFHGFLFNINGSPALFADLHRDGPAPITGPN